MTITELISDIGKIIVFLMILMSIFLITVKSSKKLSNYLFAAFLLVTAIDFSGLFLSIQNTTWNSLKIASVLLQMPLFYLYVQSVCYFNFNLKTKHLLHALLFFGMFILLMATSVSAENYMLYEIINKVQYYSYMVAVLFTLSHFKKLYQENYSANHYNTYKWLLQITILFLIGSCFVLLRGFIPNGENDILLTSINLLIFVFALFVVCWFVLKALYRPSLFLGVDKNLSLLKSKEKSGTEVEQTLEQLTNYMISEKPYLDSEISLQKLALLLNLPEKQLSQLINQQTGKHFFDYINEFRINEAKILLKENPDLTVLEILYDIGFNSKSSFYTAFKKQTSQTPTAYRKSMN
ncbi:helix-turn-helix domain-containing protein [Zhouia amylolytica]|uniref:helix-turn-helix domain-containing protein n=1 Tax=Zhouia amylolytica TaxID=376730 RepID=UPI0020CD16F5|nr:helix-turn-helix domain-containing protein [Zhouia amylolytica]MCQ0113012.1 AraC family transcriptional regulator [Zhouia amylolytica]